MKHRGTVPLFLFAIGVVGCASATDGDESTTSASEEVVSERPAAPPMTDVAGPARFLIEVTRGELDLTSEQRSQLRSIEAELERESKPLNLDRQTIEKKLALALRLGQLDAMSMQSSIDELARRVESGTPAQVRALDALWEMLDGIQRQAIANRVPTHRPPAPPANASERPLGPFFGGLELTAEQHTALLAVALPPPPKNDPMEPLLTAFENDGFRASAVLRSTDLGEHVRRHLGQQLVMTQTLLRVLDDEQRAKLARRMERAPT